MPLLHEQTIYNFIELLNNQSSLFSDRDRADLNQLIASQPDDIKQLSNTILAWCEANPEIDRPLAELKDNLSDEIKAPGTNLGKKPPLDGKLAKEMVLNAIQQSAAARKSSL